jgi:hypothetical protein
MTTRIYYIFIIIILLLCQIMISSCSGGRVQMLSAEETTCTVRNIGSTGEIRINFYQISNPYYSGDNHIVKQWVIFPLAQNEEITVEFNIIEGPNLSKIGNNYFLVEGDLPEDICGGSKMGYMKVRRIIGGGETTVVIEGGDRIYKETQSQYFYSTGCYSMPPFCLGFLVE